MEYGEGKDYATLEDAYAAMTGYNMPAAQELMKVAYDKAVAAGIYDGVSPVEIEFRVYNSDTVYVQMFTYLDTQIKEAVKGSGYEGKLSLKMTVDPDYYETMYPGRDMIFTTWGGAALAPFGMLGQVYTDAADGSGKQMEIGFDTTKVMMTYTVDGKEITDSLRNWTLWANNSADPTTIIDALGDFADYDYETRNALYAKMEQAYPFYYVTTPVYYRNVAS